MAQCPQRPPNMHVVRNPFLLLRGAETGAAFPLLDSDLIEILAVSHERAAK